MNNKNISQNHLNISKSYIIGVCVLTFVIPVCGFIIEHVIKNSALILGLFCKWFIFSAVGLRLFLAGFRQTTNPAFTAQQIFHINSPESSPIVRELGFANLCFGLIGIVSFFKPDWRIVSAFASGLYYGVAGLQHLIKRSVGANERFALWTDLVIFIILALYFLKTVQ